jgi:hypothetical protein
MFQNKTARGQDSKAADDKLWTKHEKVITGMKLAGAPGSCTKLSTSALDGRLVQWDLPALGVDCAALAIV